MIQTLDREFLKLNEKRIDLYTNCFNHFLLFITWNDRNKGEVSVQIIVFVLNLTADILLKIPTFLHGKK